MEKLRNFAEVQMGYSFRSRLEMSHRGDLAIIQMKDLLENNTVDCANFLKLEQKKIKNHHLAKKGDLVFRSRGLINKAAVLLDEPGPAVVAAPLLRIRITKTEMILPEYLNWYISQRDAQIYLNSRAEGTVQKMISKEALEELEVFLPSLEKQKIILELAFLSTLEQKLLQKYALKRKQYFSNILMKYAKGE